MFNPLASLVEKKLAAIPIALKLQMPDGQWIGPKTADAEFLVKNTAALKNLATGDLGKLGEDYVEGRVDINCSMRDLMAATLAMLPSCPVEAAQQGAVSRLISRLMSVWRHSVERDARQIEFHYDLSDDFYGLWLDPFRVYSCAYYRTPSMPLEQAQQAKLDHICRKLNLQVGERFLDLGAGWGGLLLWAAEHYGVDATGITLSKNQHAYVNQLIAKKGLSGRVRMQLLDYRKLDTNKPFEKIASVGMFEHVGRAQLDGYFTRLRHLLAPGGLILNHGITAGGVDNPQLGHGMGDFIEKYIFPGGELTHIGHVLTHMANGGLESIDVENLRPHYARTLWAWSDALEANINEASQMLSDQNGQRALRAYRLYLAGCAAGFEKGWIAIHQVLGAHLPQAGRSDELDYPADLAYPWRRDYMYTGRARAAP